MRYRFNTRSLSSLVVGLGLTFSLSFSLTWSSGAVAFCGMFVAGAGADLYNSASQVAIARVKDRTTISMLNHSNDVKVLCLRVMV